MPKAERVRFWSKYRTCTWMPAVWPSPTSSGWRTWTMSVTVVWPSSTKGTPTTTCWVSFIQIPFRTLLKHNVRNESTVCCNYSKQEGIYIHHSSISVSEADVQLSSNYYSKEVIKEEKMGVISNTACMLTVFWAALLIWMSFLMEVLQRLRY